MSHSSEHGTSSGDLNTEGNLSESSFLEALLGVEFGPTDFTDSHRFFLLPLKVTQISQMTQIFYLFTFLPLNSSFTFKSSPRRSHPANHGEGFDAPPTLERSGSGHRRAVTSPVP